jgi:hypothetical protein
MRPPQPGPFSLRQLVREARTISAPPQVVAKPHLLGLGIPARSRYQLASRVNRIPSLEAGLSNLRAATAEAVAGLSPQYREGAWGALIGRPHLVTELSLASPDDYLAAGHILPAHLDHRRLIFLGLAVVVMPDSVALTSSHELAATPVAGIAELLLLQAADRSDVSEDAWMMTRWYDSAEETAAALADLHALSGASLPSRLPASAVLLTDCSEAWQEDRLDARITTSAALLDYRITGYRPQDYLHKALVHVQRTAPDLLIVADSLESRCAPVVDAYLNTPRGAGLRRFRAGNITALISGLRSRLINASSISPGLFLVAQQEQQAEEVQPGRLPIQRAGRRLHHGKFGTFIECEVSRYFYVIDRARHAGIVSKRYALRQEGLVWNADLDGNGEVVVSKFKGQVGRVVPMDELSGG